MLWKFFMVWDWLGKNENVLEFFTRHAVYWEYDVCGDMILNSCNLFDNVKSILEQALGFSLHTLSKRIIEWMRRFLVHADAKPLFNDWKFTEQVMPLFNEQKFSHWTRTLPCSTVSKEYPHSLKDFLLPWKAVLGLSKLPPFKSCLGLHFGQSWYFDSSSRFWMEEIILKWQKIKNM